MLVIGSMAFEINIPSRVLVILIVFYDPNISTWSKLTTTINGALNFSPSFIGASTFGYNFTTFIPGASNINIIGDEVPTITSLWVHTKKKKKCDH
jgi:hypothetical protein